MNSYAAGTTVTVAIPLEDLNGDALTPTALSWRLLDETETELVSATAISIVGVATEVVISVSSTNNLPAATEASALREVELSVTTTAGVIILRAAYLIVAATSIVALKNSFQTFGQARVLGLTIPKLDGWLTADENAQRQALTEAFVRLTKLGYRLRSSEHIEDWQSRIQDHPDTRVSPRMWPLITLQDWANMPAAFKLAIRRAQVVEADDILAGNVIEQRRSAGLLSESIGESSMMFRTGKPLSMGISVRALREVEGFVDIRMTISRT